MFFTLELFLGLKYNLIKSKKKNKYVLAARKQSLWAKFLNFRIAFRCNFKHFNYENELLRIISHLYSFVLIPIFMLIMVEMNLQAQMKRLEQILQFSCESKSIKFHSKLCWLKYVSNYH